VGWYRHHRNVQPGEARCPPLAPFSSYASICGDVLILWGLRFSCWPAILTLCSTQELANANVFFNETAPADLGGYSSRIMEVTQQANPTTVWELEFHNQGAYRALHLGSLYPGVQW
jgi:hypothetical protein